MLKKFYKKGKQTYNSLNFNPSNMLDGYLEKKEKQKKIEESLPKETYIDDIETIEQPRSSEINEKKVKEQSVKGEQNKETKTEKKLEKSVTKAKGVDKAKNVFKKSLKKKK